MIDATGVRCIGAPAASEEWGGRPHRRVWWQRHAASRIYVLADAEGRVIVCEIIDGQADDGQAADDAFCAPWVAFRRARDR